jgi:hypothetical protein
MKPGTHAIIPAAWFPFTSTLIVPIPRRVSIMGEIEEIGENKRA